MDNRILIAYATKAGSTAGVAARVGEVLTGQGLAVDVLPVAQANDLDSYHTVVLGSAIRFGKLLPEAMEWIDQQQTALKRKSFSVFIVCMTLINEDEESRHIVSAYLDPVRAFQQPAHEGLFVGVMDLSKLKWSERLLMRFLRIPQGDFRKWDEIEGWAAGLVQ